MNVHVKALIVILAVALVAVPLTAGDVYAPSTDEPENPPQEVAGEITVYGYVTNLSDQEENTPLQNVEVELYSGSNRVPVSTTEGNSSVRTDSDGRFTFTFEYDATVDYYLSFDYPGYTVRSLPDLSMEMDSSGYVHFEVRPDMIDENGEYALTGTANGPHAIVMVITTGTVYGTVQGSSDEGEFNLGGATVTIVSENGQSYTTTTNGSGYFHIECPFGTYTMTVQCNGFQDSGTMTVVSGGNTPYSVVLTQNTSDVFLGLDIAHSVMLFGLILLVIVVVATFAVYQHSKKRDSEPILLNDLEDLGKDEDEIRRP